MQNVSEAFKTAINSNNLELRSRVTFPDILARILSPFSLPMEETAGNSNFVIDDLTVQRIDINGTLIKNEDFEIGIASIITATIEICQELEFPYTI